MKINTTVSLVLTVCLLLLAGRAMAVGTWIALTNAPPGNIGVMRLLSDGTVLAKQDYLDNDTNWYRLRPDIHGSYTNGSWSTNVAPMHDSRFLFSCQMLTNGNMFVAGGEYNSGKAKAEVYDPVSNLWTTITVPTNLLDPSQLTGITAFNGNNQSFADASSEILPNGRVLVAPVLAKYPGETLIFDPPSSSFLAGPSFLTNSQDEANWVKLADDSILTIDPALAGQTGTNSERYIPASNTWVRDANVPVQLYDPFGSELGPCFLLPNGKAMFFGSTTNTAVYTPSGNASPGTWAAGPSMPNGQGIPDAPAAMLANGKILLLTSPTPTSNAHAPSPTSFYEFNYVNSSFTPMAAPAGLNTNTACQYFYMLDLPDGNILLSTLGTDLYLYIPDSTPLAAGKPAITGVSVNGDGSLHISGTLFAGISEGTTYGDDAQISTAYPIVRFIDASGNIRYGRTYNWTSTSQMTGSKVSTTECVLPSGGSLSDNIQVVVNGNASDPVPLNYAHNGITWVDFNFGGTEDGSFNNPWNSLSQGNFHSASGGLIEIKAGSSSETLSLTKPMRIISYGGTAHIGP